jgi:cytochrome c oxidase cbb3-type subunit III
VTLRALTLMCVLAMAVVAAACGNAPGYRGIETYIAPDQVVDFHQLYAANCAACHGADGRGGPALGLANAMYLAIASDDVIRRAIADGIPHTPMPAFSRRAGGMLTDKQVEVLMTGVRGWGTPRATAGLDIPPYAGASAGDVARGATLFANGCASCHGNGDVSQDRKGAQRGSAITHGSYLALVSDQGLRTTIIAGRPDLGAPDWRGNLPGKHMTSQDVADVIAWLAAQRPAFAGTPYEQTARIDPAKPIEVHP